MENRMKALLITILTIIVILLVIFFYKNITKDNESSSGNLDYDNETNKVTILQEEQRKLLGSFEIMSNTITSNCLFYFTLDGSVIRYNDSFCEGEYRIDKNIITIKYNRIITPGGEQSDISGSETILIIIDENTLKDNKYGEYFKKVSDEDVFGLKQLKEKL